MALPTLQPFWVKNFKNTSEAMMVKRNQDQADFREKWNKNSQYFQKSEVETSKQKYWASDGSYHKSMGAADEAYKKSTKQAILEKRRNQLAQLICKENSQYEAEMKDLRLCNSGKLIQMRERADELKEAKEERRKKIAEEKLYENWKANEPELRNVQFEQNKKSVIKKWGEQVTEREDIQKTARDEERRLSHKMELERLRAMEEEAKKAEERKMENIEMKRQLQRQITELKLKEEESLMLKREEEQLERQKLLIEESEEKRKRFDEQRKKQEYGRVLVRQYKAQLRRKSRQVQEALELDLKILEDLAREQEDNTALKTARREQARADAEEMRKVVAEQLKLEKKREAELDLLYQEEAARQWQKRETEWERERIARERLMKEVLGERQKQVDDRMHIVQQRQQESIEERENLLHEMEKYQMGVLEEKELETQRKKEREQEIVQQITSRRERQKESDAAERQLLQRKRQDEEAYKRMLEREAEIMTAREETPRVNFAKKLNISIWKTPTEPGRALSRVHHITSHSTCGKKRYYHETKPCDYCDCAQMQITTVENDWYQWSKVDGYRFAKCKNAIWL
eukprot:gene13779-15221_t